MFALNKYNCMCQRASFKQKKYSNSRCNELTKKKLFNLYYWHLIYLFMDKMPMIVIIKKKKMLELSS